MRVGLLGAGGIARLHVTAWRSLGADVLVWSDPSATRLAAEFGIAEAKELAEVLDWANVVDICTPTPTHHSYALAAFAAGRDVLCEKPLARTVGAAQHMIRAATAAGAQLYPAHVVRYFPAYAATHHALAAGRIGRPAVLRFSRGSAAPSSEWFFDDAASGGLVMDQMIHDLDQARWMAGDVTEVFAVQNPATSLGVVPRQVSALVTLTHASGAVSQVNGSWGPPGVPFRTSFSVAGDGGVLRHSSAAPATFAEHLAPVDTDVDYLPAASAEESPYLTEIREFARAFADGSLPRVSAEDGLMAVALADAARTSIVTGQAVGVDLPVVGGTAR